MIENMLHKHRYFGHSGEIHECCPWSVTTVTPMKRGLKVLMGMLVVEALKGYNRYPDEKGTERLTVIPHEADRPEVTTVTPMKRGLKVLPTTMIRRSYACYNRYPDEKGTESYYGQCTRRADEMLQPLPR